MLAGFAKLRITPDIDLPMAGYVGLRKSTCVLDELHVRCIYFKQQEALMLVQYDLLYVDQVLCEKLAKGIADKLPIEKSQVVIAAIHTHSGPAGLLEKNGMNKRFAYIDGEYNEELINQLVQIGIKAACMAYEKQEESQLYFHQEAVHDIGANRNQMQERIDDMLSVLEIRQHSGKQAILFSFACHPTILHEDHTQYSCDLIGPAYRLLESQVEVAMFYNGACGDVSTRFTKHASTIAEVERLGTQLAKHTLEVKSKGKLLSNELHLQVLTYSCLSRRYLTDEEINKAYDVSGFTHRQQQLLHDYQHMRKYCEHQHLQLPLRILHIGTVSYVYVPVELFSKLALALKQKVGDKQIVLVSYAMDYFSYLPDQSAYEKQEIDFEAVISPFQKGCGEALIEELAKHIK